MKLHHVDAPRTSHLLQHRHDEFVDPIFDPPWCVPIAVPDAVEFLSRKASLVPITASPQEKAPTSSASIPYAKPFTSLTATSALPFSEYDGISQRWGSPL